MDLIRIENANLYRGSNRVFQDLNLTVSLGQHTAIVGPNGAGKTTLLKVLAREIYPSEGSVSIFGRESWNVWELRKRLGIVSNDLQQNYSPNAKGFDVILSGFYASIDVFGYQNFSDEQRSNAAAVSEQLGIEHLRDTQFSKMSTGEQRRHLLARALVNQPEALILDEPTSGLDIPATFEYLATIRSLIQNETTVVLVTHHVHEILPEIDHAMLLKNGMLWDQGPKSAMFSDEKLSALFDTALSVVESNGYFHVVPAND